MPTGAEFTNRRLHRGSAGQDSDLNPELTKGPKSSQETLLIKAPAQPRTGQETTKAFLYLKDSTCDPGTVEPKHSESLLALSHLSMASQV